MNTFKQMGGFIIISEYHKEFAKYLLQIPNMARAEQIFIIPNVSKIKSQHERLLMDNIISHVNKRIDEIKK